MGKHSLPSGPSEPPSGWLTLCRKTTLAAERDESVHEENQQDDHLELTKQEVDLAKSNYDFYSKSKGTQIELFELPMLLSANGCRVTPAQQEELDTFLAARKTSRIDFPSLLAVLTHLKSIELSNEVAADGDEYLDAFVFLGGEMNKEGCISKTLLIEIIKEEFGLTIDMVVSYRQSNSYSGLLAQDRRRE